MAKASAFIAGSAILLIDINRNRRRGVSFRRCQSGVTHMLGTILIIILVLALVGALPRWGHSRNWGYAPSGGLGLIVVIVIILLLLGRI
jgi:hypothetical protein